MGPSRAEVAAAILSSVGEAGAFTTRVAAPGEEGIVLGLLDDAVLWLNSQGITEQWGTRPFSRIPDRVDATADWVRSGATVLASAGGRTAGVLVLGEAASYVPEAVEPEVYVVLLVASRHRTARGVGRELLIVADRVARELTVGLLRVDCYAGGGLPGFYESVGFTPTIAFDVGGWPGQVLERRLV